MAQGCFLRSVLTLLHLVIGLASGFLVIYSLLGWGHGDMCLPNLMDHFGDPIKFQNGMPMVCESVMYGLMGTCVLSLVMCLTVNCTWLSSGFAFLHLMITLFVAAFSVFGGSAFTVYYILWCDSLQQKTTQNDIGCAQAADLFDLRHNTNNMSMYRTRMEVQQISIWAMFPLSFIAVLTYALVMRFVVSLDTQGVEHRGSYRYVILHEESTPLVGAAANIQGDLGRQRAGTAQDPPDDTN